jgi:hypothetical protein
MHSCYKYIIKLSKQYCIHQSSTRNLTPHPHKSCQFESCSWRSVLDTTLCDKVCQWLVAGQWFSPGTLVSSINKTDCHDITEILLKVVLTVMEYRCQKWPWICSTCRKHFLVLSSFMTYHRVCTRLIRRVPLVEQELLTLPEHLSSTPVFSGVCVTRSLLYVYIL